MKALKVFTGTLVVLAQLLVMVAPAMAENRPMEKKQLLVTAYYSPLPNQSFYIKGTYEADIRLNGRGTNGADGTEVYIGMLAAPKTYPFGTRVKIPGLGVGEVHDRGGAILARKNYDRIDVWMGHGEEGLSRALNWGSRLVEGEVFFTPHQVEPGLDYSWVSSELPAAYVESLRARTAAASSYTPAPTPKPAAPVITSNENEEEEEKEVLMSKLAPSIDESLREREEIKRLEQNRLLLAAGIGKDSEGEDVKNLQRMLWDLGYYKGELNGLYDDSTMDAVFRFQLEHEVVGSETDLGAGYFGKKTLAALLGALERKIVAIAQYPKVAQAWVPAKQVLPQIASLEAPEVKVEKQEISLGFDLVNKKVVQHNFTQEMQLHDKGDHVASLQNLLIREGVLEAGMNTGYYGHMTATAVINYQLKKGIVADSASVGAGRVGPKTLEVLNSLR